MKCPICSKSHSQLNLENIHSPFCSKRCADIDLYNWLSGNYTIETQEYDYDMIEQLDNLPEKTNSENIPIEKI